MNGEAAPAAPKAVASTRTAGALLAAEREKQGLSRADIAQRLHISVAQIEALESSDYSRFPRGPFLRGFTRNYARTLGLDAAALVDLVTETSPQAEAPGIVVPSQNIRFDPLGQRLTNPYIKAAGIAAAVIVLGFAAIYWWLFIRTSGVPATSVRKPAEVTQEDAAAKGPAPAPAAAPTGEAPPPAETTTTAMPAPQGTSASTAGAPATTTVSAPVPAPIPVSPSNTMPAPIPAAPPPAAVSRAGESTIRLAFRTSAWVEIVDASGQPLVSRNHPAGTTSEVYGKPPFKVVVGNVAGVGLTYNGREIDLAPHTKGTVARLTLQ